MFNEDLELSAALQNRPKPILPDPQCPICGGHGYPPTERTRIRTECACVLKARAIAYLTPAYAKATWQKSLKVDGEEGRLGLRDVLSVLIQNVPEAQFASIIKSFLLNTGMVFPHDTVSGFDIVQAWLRMKDDTAYERMHTLPFLIVRLAGDPRNNAYAETIIPLLRERATQYLRTWIYVPNGIDSDRFVENYQADMRVFLKETCVAVAAPKIKA